MTDWSALVWTYRKGTAYVPSPILHGDYLYLMTDAGLVTCLDARTGEREVRGRTPAGAGTFTASIVAYGDRLLMTSEDGDTFVLRRDRCTRSSGPIRLGSRSTRRPRSRTARFTSAARSTCSRSGPGALIARLG